MNYRLRFLTDEDFDNDIVRGLLQRLPDLDVIRVANGLPMPGVFVVSQTKPLGLIIEHLILLAECSLGGEWEGRVRHVPL